MTVAVCTTLAAFACDRPETSEAWLFNAEAMREASDVPVEFFAALEVDARGLEPFAGVLEALSRVGGQFWTYMLDDGRSDVHTKNRLRHITMGQNLCSTWAIDLGASHMLFLAADLEPPADAVPKLLEVDWPIVGGHVSTYCLDGPRVIHERARRMDWRGEWLRDYAGLPNIRWVPGGEHYEHFPPEADVREHMATAAFVMLRRDLLKRLHWRYDTEAGLSDDPALEHDAKLLGYPTWVRHDVVGRHHPEAVGPIETRYPGRDLGVYR